MDNPVGSGPLKFLRCTPGVSIELVTNENYYRGRPKVDVSVTISAIVVYAIPYYWLALMMQYAFGYVL